MEPRIQYAKTSDGVSIAFWTLGEGRPLVHAPLVPYGHTQLEWQMPGIRRWYEGLAQQRMLVGYDRRGTGLSDRDVVDYSLDAQVLDLEAIVERLGTTRFALFAGLYLGPVAIAYAARHPDKVTHLLLWCTWAHPPKDLLDGMSTYAVLAPLREADWKRYTETLVAWTVGWDQPQRIRHLAALLQEGSTPESVRAYHSASSGFDASASLKEIQSPTLVLHMRGEPWSLLDSARQLTSEIPNARLASFEGSWRARSEAEIESMLKAIDEFLGEDEPAARTAEAPAPGAFRTVLFTDLVGHTEMMSRLGDERGRAVLREHERITREVLKAHGGTEVKTMGDGFMASFGSVTKAVECAVALQRAMGALTPDPSPATGEGQHGGPLKVRCGLNAGEPIEEEGDLFGATVILAARIAARAEGGEILVADTVRGLCSGKGFLFSDRGEFVAKGFEEPVRVYDVRWKDA